MYKGFYACVRAHCLRLGNLFRTFQQTQLGHNMRTFMSEHKIKRFIEENTEIIKGKSLTPELSLRLFTPKCRFWTERPELWPFPEPFWAIYWPGGQALARYLLDNPKVSAGKKVLDLGSGCGASAISAKVSGAAYVVANDIDPVAAIATQMNCVLNGLEPLTCSTKNLIGEEAKNWDLILLGDMFYDETLADELHEWLRTCIKTYGTQILIGDPGRSQFENHNIKIDLHEQARFELPDSVKEENYGLTSSTVWHYVPD